MTGSTPSRPREPGTSGPTHRLSRRTLARLSRRLVTVGLAWGAAIGTSIGSAPLPADATPVAAAARELSTHRPPTGPMRALTGGVVSDCAALGSSATEHRARARVLELPSRLTTRPARVTLVLADRFGVSTATVTHCARRDDGSYRQVWRAAGRIGRAGFAPPGAKREGDGRTPTGTYALTSAFGARDPGTHLRYIRLVPTSCWGSTVGSTRYNRYFRGRCGPKDETMHRYVRGAYAQGLVVAYNTDPIRQGRGSAIFVHASGGGATAGCVSLPLRTVTGLVAATRPGDVVLMGVRGSGTG